MVIATKTAQQLEEQLGYVWTSDVVSQGQGGDFFFERKTTLEVALFLGGGAVQDGPVLVKDGVEYPYKWHY